ncbi:hypothetical protein [Streptomyces sp. NPDC059278]|uniref:hypothetical protein n=1 Tax=Streptomyces sp. NPDC059278 TaxID=3346801 RepID=UPI00367EA924
MTVFATPASLFIPELDGDTFASRRDLADYHDYLSEAEAENGWLRVAENNDRYAWEDEQDRLRAAAFGDFAAAFGAF